MDVFEAVSSRIACRQFIDKPVDRDIVHDLIQGAARAASSLNLQPWNVYAVTGEALRKIIREVSETVACRDWRTFETEYPECPRELWEPYDRRRCDFGSQLYGALGINRDDVKGRLEQVKRNFMFFDAPVGAFITIDRRLGPGQWADLGGYLNTLTLLARGYGLDTCPQVLWIRMHEIVRASLSIPPEQMLYCGVAIGYGDRRHEVNSFRTRRAAVSEFCKFFGFE
jgi:nitroreductase